MTGLRLFFGLAAAFSLNAQAALIDFNSLPLGTVADGVYGDARITTSSWMGDISNPQFFGTGRGTIESREAEGITPSPALWVRGFFNPEAGAFGSSVAIQADFLRPMAGFSVDIAHIFFSGGLTYFGVDADGNSFTASVPVPPARAFSALNEVGFAHLDIAAPEGGYLTGFRSSQTDGAWRSIDVGMDNLNYRVPEVTGWSIIVMSVLGMVVLKRRLR